MKEAEDFAYWVLFVQRGLIECDTIEKRKKAVKKLFKEYQKDKNFRPYIKKIKI